MMSIHLHILIIIGSQTRKCLIDNEIFQTGNDFNMNLDSDIVWRNTGDVGIETISKTIKFLGRKDCIVKKLGHKINLTKIEVHTLLLQEVDRCACIWISDKQKVVLLFTSTSDIINNEIIRKELVKCLEIYELPDEICHVNILPLNEHGKLSYSDAIRIYTAHISEKKSVKIDKFYEILHTLLQLNEQSKSKINSSSFIELGGTSIIAIQFLNSLLVENDAFFNLLKMLLNENDCIEYVYEHYKSVQNFQSKRDFSYESIPGTSKRMKTELKYDMTIQWSCNLGKCIDASPTIYEQSR